MIGQCIDADAAGGQQIRLRLFYGVASNILLVTGSGVLSALTFPPCELWWLAWVCLVPLLIALRRTKAVRASGWLALIYGVVLFACSLHWMTAIFGTGAVALFVLASLPWALFSVAYRTLSERASPAVVILMTPVLWLAAEWLRCEATYFKFSWLQLGFSEITGSMGKQLYPLIGVYGVTFLIVSVNVILAHIQLCGDRSHRRRVAMAVCLILSAFVLGRQWNHQTLIPDVHRTFKVCVVQDEVGDLDSLQKLTLKRTKDMPKLTVWPELAIADYPLSNHDLLARLQRVARTTHSALVLGCKEEAPRDTPCDWLRRRAMMTVEGKLFYNTALVIAPDGSVLGAYHKTHPIQFFSDGVPGKSYPTFQTNVGRIGIAICYDFDFASCPLSLVRNGAEILVVPTFDAMEWSALQHTQHSRMAEARAAEVGRYVVRATSSGISQIISDAGVVESHSPIGVSDSFVGSAIPATYLTPYVRFLHVLPQLCLGISLAGFASLAVRALFSRK